MPVKTNLKYKWERQGMLRKTISQCSKKKKPLKKPCNSRALGWGGIELFPVSLCCSSLQSCIISLAHVTNFICKKDIFRQLKQEKKESFLSALKELVLLQSFSRAQAMKT